MKYINKFLISHLSPVHFSKAVYVNIIPTSIETGNFQFDKEKYDVNFEFNFLDQDENLLTKGKALSDKSISEMLLDIKEDKDIEIRFVVYDIEDPDLVGNINHMTLTLTYEQQVALSKYITPLNELGDKFEKATVEIKRGACTMKDKIEKKLDSLGKSLCHGRDKTKEVAHQALDKAKNIDVSKKEAALLGAGAAVVVLSLLHKCFSKK